ncbi:MAG: hypothetical protein ABIQ74_12795 [Chitinophagales bacterium]
MTANLHSLFTKIALVVKLFQFNISILHSTFKFSNATLMASDSMPGLKPIERNNISLSIDMIAVAEMEKIFGMMARGVKITIPLQDTFWGARFGMVTDKFGIN